MDQQTSQTQTLLTEIAQENSEGAFRALFDLHFEAMYRHALRFVKNEEEAEELVADVFFVIWQKRARLPEIHNFKSYLYQSVKNRSLNHLRGKRLDTVSVDEVSFHLMDQFTDPETAILTQELLVTIEAAIAELPTKCQQIFVYIRQEKRSYKEVAALMGISPKTVENQMTIALKKLAETLKPYLESTDDVPSHDWVGSRLTGWLIFIFFLDLLGEAGNGCV